MEIAPRTRENANERRSRLSIAPQCLSAGSNNHCRRRDTRRSGAGARLSDQRPDDGIALVDPYGHELAWIDQLSDLPDDLRKLVESELASASSCPRSRASISVASFATPSTWQVETDRGTARFVLKGEEDIRRLDLAGPADRRQPRHPLPDPRPLRARHAQPANSGPLPVNLADGDRSALGGGQPIDECRVIADDNPGPASMPIAAAPLPAQGAPTFVRAWTDAMKTKTSSSSRSATCAVRTSGLTARSSKQSWISANSRTFRPTPSRFLRTPDRSAAIADRAPLQLRRARRLPAAGAGRHLAGAHARTRHPRTAEPGRYARRLRQGAGNVDARRLQGGCARLARGRHRVPACMPAATCCWPPSRTGLSTCPPPSNAWPTWPSASCSGRVPVASSKRRPPRTVAFRQSACWPPATSCNWATARAADASGPPKPTAPAPSPRASRATRI
jgi:hypothetical protein